MHKAAYGDRVTVHYIGTLDNGRIFDSREDDSPLDITLGSKKVFPALEEQIVGMKAGEVKNIEISAADAFGERRQGNIISLPRTSFPTSREIVAGAKLNLQFKDGSERVMLVREIKEDEVVLDGNHPLAGCNLTFALKLVAVKRA